MAATVPQFRKAVKREAKGRVALIGPAGSGKSFTMLTLARLLAGPDGKIAAIDTEHGSLSKYADLFDFDVLELDSFSPSNFLASLKAAEDAGYDVFCCDSLSHFWTGKDGALEFVDNARKRASSRDDMAGWKEFRPHERGMVDTMIASPCHIICTMRTKTAYEEQVNERTGKKQRVKIGLAPVQREGLEYEFDLVGAMDDDNTLIVDKSRVMFPDGSAPYTGKAITKPGVKEFQPFKEWLSGAPADRATPPARPANVTPIQPKHDGQRVAQNSPTPDPPKQEQKPPFQATDDDLPPNMGGSAIPEPQTNRVEEARQRAAQPNITRADFQTLRVAYLAFGSAGGAEYDRIAQKHGAMRGEICPKTRNKAYECFQALTAGLEAMRQFKDDGPPQGEPQPAVGLFDAETEQEN